MKYEINDETKTIFLIRRPVTRCLEVWNITPGRMSMDRAWQKKMPPPCLLYRIWNYVRILTFKVSKWLYPSSWYDRNIGKWRQCLLSIQNETKKIILILSCHRYKVQGSNQEPKTYFWNPSRFGLVGVPLVTILTLNKVCLVLNFLLLKRGQRPPEGSSQGARIDGFWYLRCQNTQRNLFYMINHFQMAPMCPLRPKMELKNYSTTVDKII